MVIAMEAPARHPDTEDQAARAAQQHDAQKSWAATPIQPRLRVIRNIRHLLAEHATEIIAAIPPDLSRTPADTLAAELLPLLEAAKFLEKQATKILAPNKLGRRGLPFWLSGLDAVIHRAPLGTILIVAPANYPLFLPGVQALQALAAGNAVTWKPGRSGAPIAQLFAEICTRAGLPANLLRVTEESIETVAEEIAHAKPAKIIFTGSARAGRAVQHLAADHSIPVIAELSGCDAILALPSANPTRLADAILFGMRLNGSATCMAPRRLILISDHSALLADLQTRFAAAEAIWISDATRRQLQSLLDEADPSIRIDHWIKPILITNGNPTLEIAQTDIFAPVITAIQVNDIKAAVALINENPYALTAALFGNEAQARSIAAQLEVGTVLINDLIAPTADPRIPFGGLRQSGFGTTRGAEGLLELTTPKTITTRRNSESKHYQPTTPAHERLFRGAIALSHAKSWRTRYTGLQQIITAARKLTPPRKS
jgi:acyl-CoA reductase-like NAD-dependent aldehyde dehydrogenase